MLAQRSFGRALGCGMPDGLRERCVLAQVIGDAANNVDIINSFFDANKGPGLCASTSQLGSHSAVLAR